MQIQLPKMNCKPIKRSVAYFPLLAKKAVAASVASPQPQTKRHPHQILQKLKKQLHHRTPHHLKSLPPSKEINKNCTVQSLCFRWNYPSSEDSAGCIAMAIRTTLQARTNVVYEPNKQRVRVNATSTVIKISTVSKSEKMTKNASGIFHLRPPPGGRQFTSGTPETPPNA